MLRTAFDFIKFDKPKSIGALVGIIISVFLIGQQVGILSFLTGLMAGYVKNAGADIWVVDNRTTDANVLGLLDVRIGRELEAISGVRRVSPVVVSVGTAKFQNGKSSPVTLVGASAPDFKGGAWNIASGTKFDVLPDGAVTVDVFDSELLGGAKLGDAFEIAGQRVYVAAETRNARGFAGAYVFTTIERARALGKISPTKASAFLVEVESGADIERVRDQINHVIFGVRAWTQDDLAQSTIETILGTSGIAASTGTLIIFAVIAGLFIIGLTLYSAAIDRIRDYATLKAIGATNRYVTNLIAAQAVMFAVIGFHVSAFFLEGFRSGVANAGLVFDYSVSFRATLLGGTMLLALIGAIFAIRRITKLEPASVFRG
ncbi:MAG: hypothetical protein HY22_09110 [[Candidatus Thermochlorobacteriaceae] bacterium GBChlB]|nr:MAG: hypothetical protein HY22_09110 [[Candidatus Thermochlorobacteriaceae] bacterium GBChlB]